MVQLTDDYVTYLTRLTASPTHRTMAEAALRKYGFDPTQPRGVTGQWTAGGNQTTVTETASRQRRRQRATETRDRAEETAQMSEAEGRLNSVKDPKSNTKNARDDARRRYGIPTGKQYRRLSPAKKQAIRQLLSAAVAIARIRERQNRLRTRIDAIKREMSHPNLTGHNRSILQHRLDRQNSMIDDVNQRLQAAQQRLAEGRRRWFGKAAEPDLTKAIKPGQRYRHGWIPIVSTVGELGKHGDRERSDEELVHASDRIPSHHGAPVDISISQWQGEEDLPATINVDTHPPKFLRHYATLEEAPWLEDKAGQPFESDYTGASLDHEGAQWAADHLHDLVAIGRSGHKAKPAAKKTKHQRAADLLDHWMDGGNTNPSDKIFDASGSDELPITYKDLRELLAAHIPAPTADDKRLTPRKVNRYSNDGDAGDLFMGLDTTSDQPLIHITGRERESTPWDPTGEDAHQTSHLTLDQAEELALKLEQYAQAVANAPVEG